MSSTPRLNYEFYFICRDCHAQFLHERPDPSTGLLEQDEGGPLRAVLLFVPNACPACHNIRPVVPEQEEEG